MGGLGNARKSERRVNRGATVSMDPRRLLFTVCALPGPGQHIFVAGVGGGRGAG